MTNNDEKINANPVYNFQKSHNNYKNANNIIESQATIQQQNATDFNQTLENSTASNQSSNYTTLIIDDKKEESFLDTLFSLIMNILNINK